MREREREEMINLISSLIFQYCKYNSLYMHQIICQIFDDAEELEEEEEEKIDYYNNVTYNKAFYIDFAYSKKSVR